MKVYSKEELATGLTGEEVQSRIRDGLVNGDTEVPTKSVPAIIKGNIVTLFNILNFILAGLILITGSYKNMLFMGVIFCNILIGTVQEIRAKRTIDKLSLISAPKATVLRSGQKRHIPVSELVLDDLMLLHAGQQVCADAVVLSGECEVNESLITGESDAVVKRAGDHLLSGSFVVSGGCHAQAEHVGADNYAAKIVGGARFIKKPNSEIMRSLNFIIKVVSIVIVPVGLLLLGRQIFLSHDPWQDALVSTVAALIGMIPEGLVLLTSVVLAVGVIRLSRYKTLVQELYCIETLARVDVLCLDKTGTITEGSMQVTEILPQDGVPISSIDEALAALVHTLRDDNPTSNAILERYAENPGWKATATVPFSSARKWSAVSFEGKGSYVLGACEFVCPEEAARRKAAFSRYSEEGQRVLVLAHSPSGISGMNLPDRLCIVAVVLISDKIRAEAPDTLRYFAEQGVCLKVISGDSAATVSSIARKAGLQNADQAVDASTLQDEDIPDAVDRYTVFGRVTPQQKLAIVKALKAKGHTVAMTGDGVNDVLALRESDCSIAMASGSDAARNVSQLVLLDSNFASMPRVVAEGRRCINNIQRSASLFLVKTIYSFILAILFIFIQMPYPFMPIQMTLISSLAIGIPSFLLGLEPNRERLNGHFIQNVLRKSLPGGLTIVFSVLAVLASSLFLPFNADQISTVCVLTAGIVSLMVLFRVCMPFNCLRLTLPILLSAAFAAGVIFFKDLFSLVPLTWSMAAVVLVLSAAAPFVMRGTLWLNEKVWPWVLRRYHKLHPQK